MHIWRNSNEEIGNSFLCNLDDTFFFITHYKCLQTVENPVHSPSGCQQLLWLQRALLQPMLCPQPIALLTPLKPFLNIKTRIFQIYHLDICVVTATPPFFSLIEKCGVKNQRRYLESRWQNSFQAGKTLTSN